VVRCCVDVDCCLCDYLSFLSLTVTIDERRSRYSARSSYSIHRPILHTLFCLIEDVGEVAATAVLAVVHCSHEDTGTALYHLSAHSSSLSIQNMLTVSVGHSLLRRSILPSPSTL